MKIMMLRKEKEIRFKKHGTYYSLKSRLPSITYQVLFRFSRSAIIFLHDLKEEMGKHE